MASRGRGRGRGVPRTPPTPPSNVSSPGRKSEDPPSPSVIPKSTTPPIDPIADEPSSGEIYDLSSLNLASRPDYGVQGQKIALLANHFPLSMPSTRELFHYDIEIEQGTKRDKIVWTSGKAFGLPRNEIRDRCYAVYLEFVKSCKLKLYEMFYDRQKSLYTLFDLEDIGNETSKSITYNRTTYMVTITACNPLKVVLNAETLGKSAVDTSNTLRNRTPLQILDLITNQFMFYLYATKQSDYIHFGRYFFKPKPDVRNPKDWHYLPCGRLVYEGFFKSLRMVLGPSPQRSISASKEPQLYLTVNVDAKKAPFFTKQSLVYTAFQTLNIRPGQEPREPLNENQIRMLNHHLRDVRVRLLHMNRTFVMATFTDVPSRHQKFPLENGRETNVYDYTKEKYGDKVELRFPNLPSVRKRGGRGGPKEWTYYPIECCEVVPHQKVELKKTTEEQSKQLIMCSAVPPDKRLKDIIEKAKNLDIGKDGSSDPFSKAFGIKRSQDLMKLDGRILPAPRIQYNPKDRDNMAPVSFGQWQLRNQRLFSPAEIGPFAVCCFASSNDMRTDVIGRFTQNLIHACNGLGIKMSSQYNGDYVKENQIDSVFKHLSNTNVRFIICIVDERSKGDRLKNAIKLGEVKYTVITQCVKPKTMLRCVGKPNDEIYKNLALKINAKNGGVNNEIVLDNDPVAKKWLRDGVMFVGMDVNHPPAQSKAEKAQKIEPKEPSVVGAVANCGKSVSDYRHKFYLQDMRKEQINAKHLRDMFTYFVDEYAENHNKKRPDVIIVYRDGVSESQFKMVIDDETLAIKEAFSSMSPPYNPTLTVITVQKRHNTRFFQERLAHESQQRLDSERNPSKNIPAGTVVDVGPVSAHLFDFFLCSHTGLQGTSKATYYVVLRDENKFAADELQRLTYLLCHCYQRCNKSVSLPAPVYHSHFVATRGKGNFLADACASDDSSSGFSSLDSESANRSQPIDFERIQTRIEYGPLIRDRMIWA